MSTITFQSDLYERGSKIALDKDIATMGALMQSQRSDLEARISQLEQQMKATEVAYSNTQKELNSIARSLEQMYNRVILSKTKNTI